MKYIGIISDVKHQIDADGSGNFVENLPVICSGSYSPFQPFSPHWVVSEKTKPKFDKSIITIDLFGTWQHVGSRRKFQIAPDSFYYILGDPTPYTVSATALDMDGWIFDRLYGAGSDLLGVWVEPATNEEVNFRADGSFTWHDPIGFDTFGTFQESKTPDLLTMKEARAHLSEIGNQLVFDAVFSGSFTYYFTVDQTDLILTHPTSGDVISYRRV